MKKFSWVFALIAALAMVFAGCGDSGENSSDKKKDDTPAPSELIIENPVFSGWGGSGEQGNINVFIFDSSKTSPDCRATYNFPTEADDFTKFEIKFTLARSDGTNYGPNDPAKKMKLVVNDRAKDNWDSGQTTFETYPEFDGDGQKSYASTDISAAKRVTFQHNSYDGSSTSFQITIDSIRFHTRKE